jgi:AcrR family transcriptional regulator
MSQSTGRRYKGRSPDERAELQREQLVAAALELFGTRGYNATTIPELCSRAGVSSRTFYVHYAGREELLADLFTTIVGDARTAVGEALAARAGSTLPQLAHAGLEAFTTAMLDDPRRARVNFVEAVGATPEVERLRRAAMRDFAGFIEGVGRRFAASGELPLTSDADIHIAAVATVGAVQETLSDWVDKGDDRPSRDDLLGGLVRYVVAVTAGAPAAARLDLAELR